MIGLLFPEVMLVAHPLALGTTQGLPKSYRQGTLQKPLGSAHFSKAERYRHGGSSDHDVSLASQGSRWHELRQLKTSSVPHKSQNPTRLVSQGELVKHEDLCF